MSVLESTQPETSERRSRLSRLARNARPPHALVVLATVWPVVWLFALSSTPGRRYEQLATFRFDLGNMTQAVWSTAHGRPLELTLASGEQANRLGVHVDPILALLAPLWWLFPTPLLLLVVQATALASATYPLYRLAERVLESQVAGLLLGTAYLLYPWVVWQAHSELHPVALALPALMWAVWFLVDGRLRAFWLAALLALLCGELVGLALVGLGAWYAIRTRRWRIGSAIAAVGATWTAVCIWVVIPAFSGETSPFYERFTSVGGSPGGLVRLAVTDPGAVLAAGTSARDITYTVLLLAPLAGFVTWAPLALLGAVPQLSLNVLSDWDPTTSPASHYVSVVVPFVFLATVYGLARFVTPRRRVVGASIVLAVSAVSFAVFAPWPGLLLPPGAGRLSSAQLDHAGRESVRQAVALVPDDAAVSATNRIAGQLSERRYVYSAPVLGRAAWVVVDETDAWIPQQGAHAEGVDRPRLLRFVAALEADSAWQRVLSNDGVKVFTRHGPKRRP